MPDATLAPLPAAAFVPPTPALRQGAAISSAAMAVPDAVVSNDGIAERLGVEPSWIVERTGVRERHIAAPEARLSDLATQAGRAALEQAGLDAADLDLLLVGTTTQDELTPNTAPIVAGDLGAHRAAAMDVGAACTAFVSGLALAVGQIEAGRARNALLIGADLITRFVDPDDRRTAALFGDGAGATVLTAVDPPGNVAPVVLRADGRGAEFIVAAREDYRLQMNGHDTFKHAVARLSEVSREAASAAACELDDIDLFVYHQANARILRAVGERLALPPERVIDCIDRFGNTSAASIPIALSVAESEGRLRAGDRVLLAAFGAGFTWGGTVLEWGVPDA